MHSRAASHAPHHALSSSSISPQHKATSQEVHGTAHTLLATVEQQWQQRWRSRIPGGMAAAIVSATGSYGKKLRSHGKV